MSVYLCVPRSNLVSHVPAAFSFLLSLWFGWWNSVCPTLWSEVLLSVFSWQCASSEKKIFSSFWDVSKTAKKKVIWISLIKRYGWIDQLPRQHLPAATCEFVDKTASSRHFWEKIPSLPRIISRTVLEYGSAVNLVSATEWCELWVLLTRYGV